MENKIYCTYILTNKNHTVLYTGITSNLPGRIYQHKNKLIKGFTSKYNLDKLVYYKTCNSAYSAITHEKQIKAGSRKKKILLIEKDNPNWKDLSNKL